MSFFGKKVDRRSRTDMVAFLRSHRRYDTMNAWNRSTSYAHCIKLDHLGLTSEQTDRAFDVLSTDYWDEIDSPIFAFTERHCGNYTICVNGRSGGYLVLYKSTRTSTGHHSWCPSCGQRNFTKVPPTLDTHSAEGVIGEEILKCGGWRDEVYLRQSRIAALELSDNEKLAIVRQMKAALKDCSATGECGVCGDQRVNYERPPSELKLFLGRSLDQYEDFEDWSLESLRDRVHLVQDFDQACDEIRANFLDLLAQCKVVEKTIMVPKKVTQLTCA